MNSKLQSLLLLLFLLGTVARGLAQPIISVAPDSFDVSISACNDSLTDTLKVYNTGSSDLTYKVLPGFGITYDSTSTKYYSGAGASTDHSFTNLGFTSDSVFFTITINGDFDQAPELCSLFVDGVFVTLLSDGDVPVGTPIIINLAYGGSTVANWLADGDINVTLANSPDVGDFGVKLHQVQLELSGATWLSAALSLDTIVAGDSTIVSVMFNGLGLPSGVYTSVIFLYSNDGITPVISIPCTLTIITNATIALSDTCLSLDTALQLVTNQLSFNIYNTECDTVIVTNITNVLPIFSVDTTALSIFPGDSATVTVSFTPTAVGSFVDTITIFNNIADTTICLTGVGIAAPVISTDVDSLSALISVCDDSSTKSLKIYNTGLDSLIVGITDSATWLNVSVAIDTILPGDSSIISIEFNALGLNTGVYNSVVALDSDDPITPKIIINCVLTVSGYPVLGLSATCLDMDTIMQWTSVDTPLVLYNMGCDTLLLDSITNASPEYTTLVTPVPILPGDSLIVTVSFNPVATGVIVDTLNIYTNAADTTICLTGFSAGAPVDSVSPDTLDVAIAACDDSSSVVLTVYNIGLGDMLCTFTDSATWLNLSLGADTIAVGDSAVITVEFNGLGLDSGVYVSSVAINSNDPLTPIITIPCTLTVNGEPLLGLSDTCIDLDTVNQHLTNVDTLKFYNTGCDTLNITNITNAQSHITLNTTSFSILPGDSAELFITFTPTIAGAIVDTLNVFSDGVDTTVCLFGYSIGAPIASAQPDTIALSITTCFDSVSTILTVYNTGLTNLNYTVATGAPWVNVSLAIDTIVPGDSTQITVELNGSTLSDSGSYISTVTITTNDPLSPSIVIPCTLTVVGYPVLALSDTCMALDTAMQWTTTDTPITFYNTGCDSLTIYNITNPGSLFDVNPTYFKIAPGDSTSIIVSFTPTAVGSFVDTLSVFTDDKDTLICLSGVGIGSPIASFGPDSFVVNFVPCNDSIVDTLTIYNTGLDTLIWSMSNSELWLSSANTSDTTLAGDSTKIAIQMNGLGMNAGSYNDTFVILSNDPQNPTLNVPVNLSIAGNPLIALSDTCLDLDTATITFTNNTTLTIYNNGCDTLSVTNITKNTTVFSIDTTALTILPGDSAQVIVSFTPIAAATYLDTLTIFSNDVDTTVCLSGVGIVPPVITINPDSFNVNFFTCTDSLYDTLTIYNSGTSDLIFSTNTGVGQTHNSTITQNYSGSGASSDLVFTNLGTFGDSVFLTITINGDFDEADEYADLYIDGQFIIQIPDGNPPVGTNIVYNYSNSGATVDGWLADGEITVTLDNSAAVGTFGVKLHQVEMTLKGSDWVTANVSLDTVLMGDSSIITVLFDGTNMGSGAYATSIIINSNDPLTPQIVVPCTLTITTSPTLGISDTCLVLDTTVQYLSSTDTVQIYNTNCDTIIVSNVTNSLAAFTVNTTSLSVVPGDTGYLIVTFAPTTAGSFIDTLTIFTNDIDTTVCLSGVSTAAPAITIDPDSFNVNISVCNDSVTQTLTIYNTGANDLIFTIDDNGELPVTATCTPTIGAKNNCCGMGISNVTFNTINNTTSVTNGRYIDYTGSVSTTVISGNTYTLSIQESNSYWEYSRVWIDYNNNGTFDVSELVHSGYANGFRSSDITIPLSAVTGTGLRMRVATDYSGSPVPTACSDAVYGQTEDYTIYVSAGITISSTADTVVSGDSSVINVKFNANGLATGQYYLTLKINSNDPLLPQISVPCTLNVTFSPVMALSDTCLTLDSVMQWTSTDDTLYFYSIGCDTLSITNITSSTGDYTVDTTALTIDPGDTGMIIITFTPTAVGARLDTLVVFSNDVDTGICLSGVGSPPPVVSVNPDSFDVTIAACDDSVTQTLTVYNTGLYDLQYLIVGGSSFSESSYKIYSTSGESTDHIFSNVSDADSLFLTITLNGDFGSSSEYADLYIDGNFMQKIVDGDVGDGVNVVTNYAYGGSTVTNWLSDGVVTVTIDNSGSVNGTTGDKLHLVELSHNGLTWLNISTSSDTLVGGDSTVINVEFKSTGLASGQYTSNLFINSNDPATPQDTVFCSLTVVGVPVLSLSDTCFDFDTITKSTTAYDTLIIYNTGCDTLSFSSITSTLVEYTFDTNALSILPFDTGQIIVTFSPTSLGNFPDTIVLLNNDQDTTICLNGFSEAPPVISYSPDSFDVTIVACDDSITETLTTYNTGPGDLFYNLYAGFGETYSAVDSQTYSVGGALTNHVFNGIIRSDSMYLTITVMGDYNSSSEYVDLYVDGDFVMQLDDGNGAYNSAIVIPVALGGTLVQGWTDDGTVIIGLHNSVFVDEGGIDLHAVQIALNGVDWVSSSITSDTIANGDSTQIDIKFRSSGLSVGTYYSWIRVQSNDQLSPMFTIPCTLTVNGSPIIGLSDTCIDMDTAVVGVTNTDTLQIFNNGCDTLSVTGAANAQTIFSTDTFNIKVSSRISHSLDDAEEYVSNGGMDLTSSDLEFVDDGATAQIVGMRFQDINVPQGATIVNAYIKFECDEADAGATNLTVYGEDINSSVQFMNTSYNISLRTKTTASVSWDTISPWTVNNKYQTPNLATIVEEVVGRAGWASGNPMTFIVEGSGERTAEAFNGESEHAPLLVIQYAVPTMNILPGDTGFVIVNFTPSSLGNFTDTINIFNNDVDATVCLSGTGIGAPIISVDPDSFNVTIIACDDSVTQTLTVYNTGTNDLIYSMEIDSFEGDFGGLPIAATCYPITTGYCCNMGIYNVTFNTINNTSSNGSVGYEDFTGINTTVGLGQSYSISIQTGTTYNEDVEVWIDFNNNGIFTGGENVFESLNTYVTHTGTINIPSNAIVGKPLRMRIASNYAPQASPQPCSNVQYGQFEDYTIIINSAFTFSIMSDTVAIGDSSVIDVEFNANDLDAGQYTSLLYINSNDPVNPQLVVPCTLQVVGAPVLSLVDTCFDFDTVTENYTSTDTLFLINTGCDTLSITNITNTLTEFSVDTTAMNVMPDDTGMLFVTFAPTSVSSFVDTLNVFTNDLDTTICLAGVSSGAAVISVDPDSLEATITVCHDSVTQIVTVYNTGVGDLIYNVVPGIGKNFDSTSTIIYTTYGEATDHDFTSLPPSDSVYLTITLNGDFDWSSEWAELYVDGDYLGIIVDGDPANGTDIVVNYAFSGAQVQGWLADGEITVTIDNNGNVDNWSGDRLHKVQLQLWGVSWINSSITSDTVVASDSSQISIELNALELTSGVYTSTVVINSNDPLTPQIVIPCTLTVIDNPRLVMSDSCLQLDTAQQNVSSSDTLWFYNTGCDTLFITNITNTLPEFTFGDTAFTLMPSDTDYVIVTFTPTTVATFSDSLQIVNSDADTFVCLTGVGIGASVVAVDPDTLNATILSCDDSVTQNLTIYNNGVVDLTYFVEGGSSYDSTKYNIYSTNGEDSYFTFYNVGNTDSLYLTITLNGDFSSTWEYAFLTIDGNSIGNIDDGNVADGTDIIVNYAFGGAQLAGWLADGNIVVGINNVWDVDGTTGDRLHQARLYHPGLSWLSVTDARDTVAVGDSSVLGVQFKSTGLASDVYTTNLKIQSNDPVTPTITIPATLTVDGVPILALSDTCIVFDSTMELTTSIDTLWIYNSGCDSLIVTNITNALSIFTVNDTSFSIEPWDTGMVIVSFSPTTTGSFFDTLTIFNDDVDTVICLSGVGVNAPVITVNPDSFDVTIVNCDDSVTQQLTVYNTGLGSLTYDLYFDSLSGSFGSPKSACTVTTTGYCCNMGIWNVTFNSINNSTNPGWEGYQDYSSTIGTFVNAGSTYTLSVTTGTTYNEDVCAWIDFNDNGVFEPSEKVIESLNTYVNHSTNVLIPLTAVKSRSLRMRVVSNYAPQATPTACANVQYGQFEDYTVVVNGIFNPSITSDTIMAGDSSVIDIQFNANGINSGQYFTDLTITSNDPANSPLVVPCTLTIVGAPSMALSDTCLDLGSTIQYIPTSDSFSIINLGCDTLDITNITNVLPDFTVDDTAFIVLPYDTGSLTVTFSSTSIGTFFDTLTIFTNDVDTTICITGASIGAPIIAIDPDSFNVTLVNCNDSTTLPLTVYNNGVSDLIYSIEGVNGNTYLDSILSKLNQGFASITSLIPDKYDFSDGILGTNISDGGDDMYDGGNYLGTNLGGSIPYSNNLISSSALLGPKGKYFTRKYNGLFVFAANLDGISSFEITGNNGADGDGTISAAILSVTLNGATYTGYVKRIYAAGDPSINHLIIVKNSPTTAHNYSSDTNDDDHEVTGLGSTTQIYYLLYASYDATSEGTLISNTQTRAIMTKFLEVIELNNWLGATPTSDSVVGSDSSIVTIEFNGLGLNTGTYNYDILIESNDSINTIINVPVILTVNGTPDLALSDTCITIDSTMENSSTTDSLTVINNGCDTLFVTNITNSLPEYGVDSTTLTVLPFDSERIVVTFSPTSSGTYLDTLQIFTNDVDTLICLSGVGYVMPVISVSPDSLQATIVTCTDSTSLNLTINNTGLGNLDFTICDLTTSSSLENVLSNLNTNFTDVTGEIPAPYSFTNGVTGNAIPDGGNDMYDWGNYISTNFANDINYSDDTIINDTAFGATGRYFTRKYDGLFVLGADLDSVAMFEISGELGADGTGNVDASTVVVNSCGGNFKGFIKRVYNAGDPSVNHLVIVENDAGVSHSWSANTDNDYHEITNLTSKTRIYYLLYAGTGGGYINDNTTSLIMTKFLETIYPSATWLSTSVDTGSIATGDSTVISVQFNATGFNSGQYTSDLMIYSNDPINSPTVVPCTLTVSGPPNIALSDSCVDLDTAIIGATNTDTVQIFNTGCDTLTVTGTSNAQTMFFADTFNVMVSSRIRTGLDDAEEYTATGGVDYLSTDLEFVNDGAIAQMVGMRFQNISVPQAATIVNAYIKFECDEADAGTTNLTVSAEDVDSSNQFTIALNNISTRTKTSATVAWNALPPWVVNNNYKTPDLTTIVQELVDRAGWTSGNPMTFIVEGNGERTAESFEGEPENAPLLVIQYAAPTMSILPGDTGEVVVNFLPSGLGNFTDTLTIFNNDVDTTICLSGVSLNAPAISVAPDSFDINIVPCNDSVATLFTVYNTGFGELDYIVTGGSYFDSTSSKTFSTAGETTIHNFPELGVDDSIFVTITLNGDFDGGNEYADLYIDGDFVTQIADGNPSNGTDIVVSYSLGGANVSNWLADGAIAVSVDNSPFVGAIGVNLHRVQLRVKGVGWMTVSSMGNDTLFTGDSTVYNVEFNSLGLISGVYTSEITVYSNDPSNTEITVPCTLTVVGAPVIVPSDTCVYLDSIMEFTTSSDTIYLANTGCDTLLVTNITNSLAVYTVDSTSLTINPSDSARVIITFSPVSVGTFLDTLTIVNNDADTLICLSGYGFARPIISLNPDSFNVNISGCCDSLIVPMTVYNNGLTELTWNITNSFTMSDDFDPGIDDSQWASYTGTANSLCGSNVGKAMHFDNNGMRQATTYNLDLRKGGTVDFYLKIGTGAFPCENANAGEDIVLEYSTNGGLFYSSIATYDSEDYAVFTLINEAIPDLAKTDSTILRWRQITHNGTGTDNWALDNVSISGSELVSASPDTGTIGAVDSQIVTLTFYSCGFDTGTFIGSININSNDPLSQRIIIPTILTVDSIPIAPTASSDTICETDPVPDFSVIGTGIKWYSDPALDTLVYSGNPFASGDSTAGLYVYYVTQSDTSTNCEGPADTASLLINAASVAPTGAATSTDTICAGQNVTLTVTGGALGLGATWEWYTTSCGGTPAGTGDTLIASPIVTTTYYVRGEGTCDTTICQNVVVTVTGTVSTPPSTSYASNDTICLGDTTLLIIGGGSLGSGATWEWYTLNCGGTPLATGDSVSVFPVVNTTYFVRAEGNCDTTTCDTVFVIIGSSVAATNVTASDSTVCTGDSSLLKVNGGSLGVGASWQWYSGSCGGVPVGGGDSIYVLPGATTTYYARAEGTCNTTVCDSAMIKLATNSTAAVSASATTTSICIGDSTTLVINGGALGVGATWQWYSASCGGVAVGTGDSLKVSPAVATTYFVRAESSCDTTTCVSVAITVNLLSTTPTVAAVSTTICSGDSTEIYITAGTLGTGATWQWYTASCGGVSAGTGDTIMVTPLVTTKYYGRAEGTCNTTVCDSVTITIGTNSTAPAGASATVDTVCTGDSTVLVVSGGALGTGATWQWYSASCGGTPVGTGDSLSVFPVATTTYYVRGEGGCDTTACASVTITTRISSTTPTVSATSQTICAGDSTTLFVSAGVLGTGATYQWYTTSCGGVGIGAGDSITVTPLVATTYYVRAEGTCNTTSCDSITIGLGTPSTAPVGATASIDTVCTGDSTILMVTGGALGLGADWQWYSASCGGTFVGTGDSLSVFPSATTTYFVRAEGGCDTTTCASITITFNVLSTTPTVSASVTTICVGDSSILSITGGILGTGAGWQWYSASCGGVPAGSGTSITVTPIVSTTYYARAEGTCNTTSCDSVTITIGTTSTAPVGATASADPLCSGDSTVLMVTGGALGLGADWQWYSGSCGGTFVGTGDSLSVFPAATTTYYVRAEGGCDTTTCASITITMNSASTTPTVSASVTSICVGDSSILSITGGALGTGATWQWYSASCGGVAEGAGTSITVTPLVTTTYYARAEGTCNTTVCDSVTIIISTLSTPAVSAAATSNSICVGDSTVLLVNGGVLGSGANWAWYSASCGGTLVGTGDSLSVFPVVTTTYFVRAEGGCDTTTCVSVAITVGALSTTPTIAATTTLICAGDSSVISITGGALGSGATWQWYSVSCGGTPVGTGTSITVTPLVTTAYFARAEGSCNTTSCDSLIVVVRTTSSPAVSILPTPDTICAGNSSTLLIQGGVLGTGANWKWYTGSCGGTFIGSGNSIMVSPIISSTYYVRAEGICDTTICTSVMVIVDSLVVPPPAVTSEVRCFGEPVPDLISTGSQIKWYLNAALTNLVYIGDTFATGETAPGIYTYFVTDTKGGCQSPPAIATLTIHPSPPVVVTGRPTAILPGDSTTLSAFNALTFLWSPNIGLRDTVGSVVRASPPNTMKYYVFGTDKMGCVGVDSIKIYVEGTGIVENGTIQYLNIFPNPTLGSFMVDFIYEEGASVQLNVLNLMGQMVISKKIKAGRQGRCSQTFDLKEFAPGIYYLQVVTDKGTAIRKVIREN